MGSSAPCFFADSISWVGGISWSSASPPHVESERGSLSDSEGNRVIVGDLDVVWWRRMTGEPRIPVSVPDGSVHKVVVNDCQAALLGLLLARVSRHVGEPSRGDASGEQQATSAASRAAGGPSRATDAREPGPGHGTPFLARRPRAGLSSNQSPALKIRRSRPDLSGPRFLTDHSIRICPANLSGVRPWGRAT